MLTNADEAEVSCCACEAATSGAKEGWIMGLKDVVVHVTAAALIALVMCVLTVTPARAEFGLVPDSMIGRAHPTVPLMHRGVPPMVGLPFNGRWADAPGILATLQASQAGSHPDATGGGEFQDTFNFRVKDFEIESPPGFVGIPRVVPICSRVAFELFINESQSNPVVGGCSPASQVGVASYHIALNDEYGSSPLYRLSPSPGVPASFGFRTTGGGIIVNVNVRTDEDYGLRISGSDITTVSRLLETVVTLWGVPASADHDGDRWIPSKPALDDLGGPLPSAGPGTPPLIGDWGGYSGVSAAPFLQLPSDCNAASLVTTAKLASWQEPNRVVPEDPTDPNYAIPAPQPTGCDELNFDPSIALAPAVRRSDTPTGASIRLVFPDPQDPGSLSTPPLKKAMVTLPEGVSLSPAAADGLEGCTTAQIGLTTTDGAYPNPIRFAKYVDEAGKVAERCPDASKVGTATVVSPALEDPLPGDVYVAQPFDNPFNSRYAMYLVVRGPGFTAKLPGKIDVDDRTGRITTTFDHSPQLPVESVELDLFGGPRAALATPPVCGLAQTVTELTPWSYPQSGPPAMPTSSFEVVSGPGGCPVGLAGRPFDLSFAAGTVNPVGRSRSPFALRLERPDGRQELDRIDVTTPEGFVADLSKVPYCPESAIAQAIGRTAAGDGAAERSNPSCPAASRVGSTAIGAGAGSSPFYVSGDVYLAGPYKGAPLSLVFVVPAIAGPFDLGVQVVRAAAHVDRKTARVTTVSDAIPKILGGVPLRVRDVRVDIDRPRFAVNPSSCAEKRVNGIARGSHGAQTALGSRFQVADCVSLPFKPRLALRLTGRKQIKTGRHPGVRAQVNQTGIGEAGIKKAVVRLPKSLALDPDNAQSLCEFADGTADDLENRCPKGSIVGRARAVSPLLKRPLAGNVYFVKNVRRDLRTGNLIRTLPMIVVALRGEIAINLYGESSTTAGGKLVNTFASVPDAPISRFNLNIAGGKAGILVVTQTAKGRINLCAKPRSHVAEVDTDGQNGKRHDFDVRMKTPCTKKQIAALKRKAAKRAKRAAARRR